MIYDSRDQHEHHIQSTAQLDHKQLRYERLKLQSKIFTHLRDMGSFQEPQSPPKPSDMAMSSSAMIPKTQRSILFEAQRNWTINSIDRKIEATIKDICIFRGHMVVLGAPKSSGRAKIFEYLKLPNFGQNSIETTSIMTSSLIHVANLHSFYS